VLLGVVQGPERTDVRGSEALQVEQDSGGNKRSSQTASPRLIGPRDKPRAQRAIEREQVPTT
jgi:hypothetical protein